MYGKNCVEKNIYNKAISDFQTKINCLVYIINIFEI